jgi:DNA-3-methyladenine glycosylase II
MTQKTVVTIEPLAPFDLSLSSLVFATGDRKVRSFQGGWFSQVVEANGRLVWVRLASEQCSVDKPKLTLELYSEKALSEDTVHQVQLVVNRIFSLNTPLNPFYSHVQKDGVMSQLTQRLVGFKFPVTPTVFEALVDAIVEQQISIKVARNIEERLAVMFGESIRVEGEVFFAFPTAAALVEAGVDKIRQTGLSLRKAEYIYGAAQLVVRGDLDLEKLQECSSEEVVLVLDAIRGVGVWTAELTMLRGMGRFDVLPADDFGLRRVISRYYCGGRSILALEARQIAERWGDWRGLAAFYLIIAEALGVQL